MQFQEGGGYTTPNPNFITHRCCFLWKQMLWHDAIVSFNSLGIQMLYSLHPILCDSI